MATTSPDNIVYPLATAPISPINTHFANLATSAQAAITDVRNDVGLETADIRADYIAADTVVTNAFIAADTVVTNAFIAADTVVTGATDAKLNATSRTVANQAARDALYPTPVQGNRVYRVDTGWEEAYYGLYNVTTNPGGSNPAGWYPVSGKMPSLQLTRPLLAGTPGGAWTNVSNWSTVSSFGGWTVAGANITPTVKGWYSVVCSIAGGIDGLRMTGAASGGDQSLVPRGDPSQGILSIAHTTVISGAIQFSMYKEAIGNSGSGATSFRYLGPA